jgi:hypothetical protein
LSPPGGEDSVLNLSVTGGGVAKGPGGPWGHVLVSASACVLTVSIAGSAVFLTHRLYSRHELRGKVRAFIASLENRTPQELADRVAQLKQRPRLTPHLLPEVTAALRRSRSEQQLCAAIQISRAFLDHKRVVDALVDLRGDGREIVAAAAVGVLAELAPAERAASVLGQCLADAPAGGVGASAIDAACAGLYQMGGPGLAEAKRHLPGLTIDRRIWLAGYVHHAAGPHRRTWLEMLAADPDERVKGAAQRLLTSAPPPAPGAARDG